MNSEPQKEWLLVRADAVPAVFRKVLETKTALQAGAYASVSEAAKAAGISRSAYYKYKDGVFPYTGEGSATVMTFRLLLEDSPGVLSGLLSVFAGAGANILTVNQQPPAGGMAPVAIGAQTERMTLPIDLFVEKLGSLPGVRRITDIRRKAFENE